MKKNLFIACVCFFSINGFLYSQTTEVKKDSTEKKEKIFSGKVFGNIYTDFYRKLNADYAPPKSGFEMKSAVMGYKTPLSEKVDATIMFDVSRTTRDIRSIKDSSLSSTEGSNYTAFLKQAEIHWKINKFAEFSAGMLLSSQFLLTQDKFWGHRYLDFTFQETSKYGSPCDFGVRLKLNPIEKLFITFNMLNGDGPIRWQDENGKYLYSGDVEYRQSDNLIFKIYGDYKEAPSSAKYAQSVLNGFVGYVYKNLKLSGEYTFINNVNYTSKNIDGFSGYAIYKFMKKLEVLARYDNYRDIYSYKYTQYLIGGFQYEPAKNYFISINYRELLPSKFSTVYLNFGIKF